jgi:hypothetical protein
MRYSPHFTLITVVLIALIAPDILRADPLVYVYSALGQFGTVDLANGGFQSLPTPDVLLTDLNTTAGSPVYVIDADTTSNLRTLDPFTGQTTLIGATGQSLQGIEVDPGGLVFGQTADSLYSLDPSTGAATLMGVFGNSLNFDFSQGAFEAANLLYVVGHTSGDTGTSLYRINVLTGTAELIGANNFFVETIVLANDTLYGFTGTLGSPDPGPIVMIDPQTGIGTALVNQDPNLAVVIGAGTQSAATPEPTTWAASLAGIGLIAVATLRRKTS